MNLISYLPGLLTLKFVQKLNTLPVSQRENKNKQKCCSNLEECPDGPEVSLVPEEGGLHLTLAPVVDGKGDRVQAKINTVLTFLPSVFIPSRSTL